MAVRLTHIKYADESVQGTEDCFGCILVNIWLT